MICLEQRWFGVGSRASRNGSAARRRRCYVLERLENRTLLSGSPTVYTVDLTGDTGASTSANEGTLLYCITQANANPNTAGSEIAFDPTVFATPRTITLLSTLVLAETQGPEAIDGPGASDVTISGDNAVEVLSVSSGVAASVSGLTVADGQDPMPGLSAGGIFNQGTLTLTDCTISGNFNAFSFSDDTNYSDFGGGITNQGTLTVADSTISGNTAGDGGGIFNLAGATMTVTGSTISGSYAGEGGAILNEGTVTITGSAITGNSAVNIGGGIYNGLLYGTLTLTGCTISGNHARYGGAISNNFSGTATVTDCTLSGNAATSNAGGAIFTSSSEPVTVSATTISNNTAIGDGGGIFNGGPNLTVTDCTLSGNTAAAGGGIYADNPTTVIGSTVSGNSASGSGGGIANQRFELSAVNCTIAGNSAGTSGGGLWNAGPVRLTNCTIAYNVASDGGGGGLAAVAGVTTLDNTIVALNTDVGGTPADDIATSGGTLSSTSEYNLIGTGGAGGLINGSSNNLVGVADPGLDTLADYGGPTQTIALLPGSPAIDAGSPALAVDPQGNTLSTDQRGAGYPRIVNGTVDIGAFETGPTVFTVDLTTDTGASTTASAGDLLYCITQANAQTNPSGSVIQFDPTVFDTPQTITLTNTLDVYNPNVPEVIDGPGANLAAISGDNTVVVFNAGGDAATIGGLTIEDGSNPGLDGMGGGIESGGTVTVNDCTIANNFAGDFGGGIANNGTLSVNGCTLSQNSTRDHGGGGGIANINGQVTVTDSTISDNSGGGFWETGGKLTINTSTVEDNSGPGISATSGGNHSGTVSVSGCTIAGNSSQRGGGGIFVSDGALTVANSTIADNSAIAAGGGIEVTERSRPLTIVNSTIAGNDVSASVGFPGGGLFVDANCTATLNNTIVARNTDSGLPDDIGGTGTVSGSNNLIGFGGSAELGNGTNGNQVGVTDPGFDPNGLQNNGGPTQTIALLAGSPAIDAGSNALAVDASGNPLAYDQRGPGFPRIVNGTVDIGAYEFQGSDTNPPPLLALISPSLIAAGHSSPIALAVNGLGFNSQSVVDWSSTALATTYVSPTELAATIPSSDFGSLDSAAITVTNVATGGGTSTSATFEVLAAPTTVYVSAAYASDPPGAAVTWTDGSTHDVGYDAFATIPTAVAAVAAGGTVDFDIAGTNGYVNPDSDNTFLVVSILGGDSGEVPPGDAIGFSGSGGTVVIQGESFVPDVFSIKDTSVQFDAADGLHRMTINFDGAGLTRVVNAEGTTNTFDIEGVGANGPSGDLNGYGNNNAFDFGPTGKVLGSIAGGERGTLNYSAYSTAVTVNLGNAVNNLDNGTDGTATGVSGTVADITAVIGGNFNDTLSAGSVPFVSLTGGSGTNSLSGTGIGDSVVDSISSSYTLTNSILTGSTASFTDNLSGIRVANLTGSSDFGDSFNVSGWTGSGTLAVSSGFSVVTATKDADMTLTNSSLMSSDGMSLSLSHIVIAELTATAAAGSPTDIIDASAFSGLANLSATGTVNAVLFGGSGAGDTLTAAGSGNEILIGGAGHDTLVDSGAGDNILIGAGAGGNTVTSNGNDILIGGTTSFDSNTPGNIVALDTILAEWTSSTPYAKRITAIEKGVGFRHRDAFNARTIQPDAKANTLSDGKTQSRNLNWFLASRRDNVTKKRNETRTII